MPEPRRTAGIVAPRRLYLTLDGEVVEANDPRRHTLLAASGLTISQADVARYGVEAFLAKDQPEEVAAITSAPETGAPVTGVVTGGDAPTVSVPGPNLAPVTPEPEVSEPVKALEKLTVEKLKKLAAENGVTLVGDEKKADLVTALASRGVKAPE